jgi:hypothetical protein
MAKNFILIVAAIIVGGLALCFIALFAMGGLAALGGTVPVQTFDVRYELTGSAETVSVTLSNGQGNTEQRDVELPYSVGYEGVEFMNHLYISAQITDQDGGDLKCRILVNGEELSSAVAEGFPNIATCSGIAE